ncbi:MAG TPA: hypothetical protein PK876_10375 [Elusimicrobiota bacterium]|nr:hypothetical protein [Elusimicrobiota bacterium]
MTKEKQILAIRKNLIHKLGDKLTGKLGKGRISDIARDIADYKEQVGWPNTPQEIRRLQDKIRYIPAEVSLGLSVLRLSKKSEIRISEALWGTLKSAFPSMRIIQPN